MQDEKNTWSWGRVIDELARVGFEESALIREKVMEEDLKLKNHLDLSPSARNTRGESVGTTEDS